MRAQLELIGFHGLYDRFKNARPYEFQGQTVQELLETVIAREGYEVKKALWNEKTSELDSAIQVLVNGKFLPMDKLREFILHENDRITFLLFLTGG